MRRVKDSLRRVFPSPLWTSARALRNHFLLSRGVRRLRRLAPRAAIPPSTMDDLVTGWDNPWSLQYELIHELWQRTWTTPGPILDVGSGLSTLVLGIVAQRRGIVVMSLEHDAEWHRQVQERLARYDVGGIAYRHAPLGPRGEFDWYQVPADLPRDIALVLCDGPPWDTRGGRYGLLPSLQGHLAPGCVILLDDAARPGEQAALVRWSAEYGGWFEIRGRDKPFAVMLQAGAGGGLKKAQA